MVLVVVMDLYPAIDLRGGRAVRLQRGDFAAETVYDDEPVARALRFATAGASWVHVVDLDAARTGAARNHDVIAAIAAALQPRAVAVQAGGGIRDAATAATLARAGVARVVLGTAAVEEPDVVEAVAAVVPVALGLDVRGREVAVRGWTEGSGLDVLDVITRFAPGTVEAVVVTQITQDGTLGGPDVDGLAEILAATAIPVIASGGVGSLDDLRSLDAIEVAGRRLAGVIVGTAIYEGRFSVEEALACVSPV